MSMVDRYEAHMLKKEMMDKRHTIYTHLYIVDDMMSEILILDNPEAMREIAAYVKTVLAQLEGEI